MFLSSPQSHVTASRRALEAFLVRYPLCYGYWKKYADLERRAGYNDKAEEVKQEGINRICIKEVFSTGLHELVITFVVSCVRCASRVCR